jgi:hypothetical protein
MNSAKVFGKQVKLTYIHPQKANATVLESTVVLNSANKVTGKYSFQSGKGSVKYTYTNSSGATLEPSYDFNTDAWSYSASQTLGEGDTVKLTYETSKKVAGLEWTRDLKQAGSFKVSCSGLLLYRYLYASVHKAYIYIQSMHTYTCIHAYHILNRSFRCVFPWFCMHLCTGICMHAFTNIHTDKDTLHMHNLRHTHTSLCVFLCASISCTWTYKTFFDRS